MLRSFLVLLLLLNGALALWAVGLQRVLPWPMPGQSAQEPDRVALQVRPEAIRLVGESVPSPGAASDSAPGTAGPASAPAPAAETVPPPAAEPPAPAAVSKPAVKATSPAAAPSVGTTPAAGTAPPAGTAPSVGTASGAAAGDPTAPPP